jgi:hypothetical protein
VKVSPGLLGAVVCAFAVACSGAGTPAPPVEDPYPLFPPAVGGQLGGSQLRSNLYSGVGPAHATSFEEVFRGTPAPSSYPGTSFDDLALSPTGDLSLIFDDLVIRLGTDYAELWRKPIVGFHCVVDANGGVRALDETGIKSWDPAGNELWLALPPTAFDTYYIGRTPLLGADGTLYLVGLNLQHIVAIGPDGLQRWSYSSPMRIQESGSLDQAGNLYFYEFQYANVPVFDEPLWQDQWLVSLDRAGQLRFRTPIEGRPTTEIMVAGNGDLVFGDREGVIRRYTNNGTELWHTEYALAVLNADGSRRWESQTAYWGAEYAITDAAGHIYWIIPEGGDPYGPPQAGRLITATAAGSFSEVPAPFATFHPHYNNGQWQLFLAMDGRLIMAEDKTIYEAR